MNSESTTMTKEEIRLMLQTNSKGAVMQSLGNCMLVFQNDPLLKGAIRRNSLTERIDIEKDLGWCRSDTAVTDTDINYLRLYFERHYNYQSFWNHFMKTIGWKSYLALFCTGDYVRSIMQRNKQ